MNRYSEIQAFDHRIKYLIVLFVFAFYLAIIVTSGRRQSKTLFTIDERGSEIDRNSVFDCHLSPVGRQMTIENSVSDDFLSTFVDSIDVLDCRLPGVIVLVALLVCVLAGMCASSFASVLWFRVLTATESRVMVYYGMHIYGSPRWLRLLSDLRSK